jgi:hypothetical protein
VKTLSMAVGAAILFTTAHVSILATGGYGGSHAYIALGVAAGVAVASIAAGRAWGEERRKGIAIFLIACIATGEVFTLLSTAERLTAAREASQAPLRQAVEARQKLETRVAKAEAAVTALPETSARFREAMLSKAAADAAVVTKSAERGCAANCRLLLQAQADQNQQEVEAARRDMAEHRIRLEQAVTDARADLTAFKAPPSASPLADRIGWPAWVLDLVMAALGSIALNGLACALMAFGSHRKAAPDRLIQSSTLPGSIEQSSTAAAPETAPEPQRMADGTQGGNVVPIRPAGRSGPPSPDAIKQAKGFMVARVTLTDDDAETDVRALYRDYVAWMTGKGSQPLPETDIGAALVHLFKLAQIPFGPKDGKAIARGIAIKA